MSDEFVDTIMTITQRDEDANQTFGGMESLVRKSVIVGEIVRKRREKESRAYGKTV